MSNRPEMLVYGGLGECLAWTSVAGIPARLGAAVNARAWHGEGVFLALLFAVLIVISMAGFVIVYRRISGGLPRWMQFLGLRSSEELVRMVEERTADLRKSEERHRAMFEKNRSVQLLLDPGDGTIVDANSAACTFYGHTLEQLRQMKITDINLMPAGDVLREMEAARCERRYCHHFQHRRADGQIRDVEVHAGPIPVNGRQLLYAIIHDITDRKQVEARLSESESVQRLLLENIDAGVVIVDADTHVIERVNKKGADLFGEAEENIVGRMCHCFLCPAEVGRCPVTDLGQEVNSSERLLLKSDGSKLPILKSVRHIQIDGKDKLLETFIDITDRIRTEKELRETNVALERQTVVARELAAKAEQGSAAKSEFLAVMSHEIRTPMNGIIGITNILRDTKLGARQQEFVETIDHCAESLLALINDILDFTKIESGNIVLESEPFDVRKCIEEALGVCAQSASQKGLELVCDFESGAPEYVQGDSTRLRQVLINLVGNAVKFTAEGEVTVSVSFITDESGQSLLKFQVRDSGIGIPEDKIPKLFKLFSQADSSTTRRYGGTGLGLAICKRLVKLMGGEIDVRSVPGEGSTFEFTIAASRVPPPETQAGKVPLDGVCVLVVDDNKSNRDALCHLLHRWGMCTVEADGAASAFARLDEAIKIDLVVTDLMMPDIDGVEMIRRIRKERSAKVLPAILLSSLGVADASMEARAAGIEASLLKPVRHDRLRNVVTRVLLDTGRVSRPTPSAGTMGTLPSPLAIPLGEGFPLRILMAEDYPVNQTIALLTLKKLGYAADIVSTGLAAFEAVQKNNYDVVFMDMHMPDMDGLEATRRIRLWETESGVAPIYIIALTADAMTGDREKCISAGMDDYLSKPLRLDEMRAVLQCFVQR